MSDRTAYTLRLRRWDPAKFTDLMNAVEGIMNLPDQDSYSDTSGLTLQYFDALVGRTRQVAEALRAADDTAGFVVWEDAQYDYLGTIVISAPGEPLFEEDCDAQGRVVLNYANLLTQTVGGLGFDRPGPLGVHPGVLGVHPGGKTIEQAFGNDVYDKLLALEVSPPSRLATPEGDDA